ncbi:MAG: hypothetical protein F6J87_21415 [Spirulina sp. SIO3F2]|nr:hypothetical protein [Spirulina sp. SIO3F2]
MQLIPCDQFSILTSKTLPEVVELLDQEIEEQKFFFPSCLKPFTGWISESGFAIQQTAASSQNQPLIYIQGEFSVSPYGVAVRIQQDFNPFYLFFTPLFWLVPIIFIPFSTAISPFTTVGNKVEVIVPSPYFFIGAFMGLIINLYFIYRQFYRRVDINKRFFYKLIHGIELPLAHDAKSPKLNTAETDSLFEKRLLNVIKWVSLAIAGLFLFAALHTAQPNSTFTEKSPLQPTTYCPPSTISSGESC